MSLVVRIIAPTGRDAELITAVLQQNGVVAATTSAENFFALVAQEAPIGPLLLAEEALSAKLIEDLSTVLARQAPWSDLPVLILTGSGRETSESHRLQAERLPLGSPILLERPIRTATLISSVKAALRARMRQYEIRDALAELKLERETLQAMLDNLQVGVIMAKADGELVLGNRRLETLLRHPMITTSGVQDYDLWPVRHTDGTPLRSEQYPLARAMRSGRALPPEEYLYERGDGTTGWISLTASPIVNEQGKVQGGVVTIADIDQQKRAEAALIQNEKLAAVGRLAASISHEINNPLEAVTNLLYLASRTEGLPEEARRYIQLADTELARVSQIASHTLRFHRQSTKPSTVTARELLEPTLGLYAGRLSNAKVSLTIRDRSTRDVICSEGEIRQVLNNLIGNAVEAMRHGGKLVIHTSDSVEWRTCTPGVRVTIADTGHGMSKDVAKRIFEAFYTTKGMQGTGLGLWISKGIVDKHHGTLRVRSSDRPGTSGTTFSLFLPQDAMAD